MHSVGLTNHISFEIRSKLFASEYRNFSTNLFVYEIRLRCGRYFEIQVSLCHLGRYRNFFYVLFLKKICGRLKVTFKNLREVGFQSWGQCSRRLSICHVLLPRRPARSFRRPVRESLLSSLCSCRLRQLCWPAQRSRWPLRSYRPRILSASLTCEVNSFVLSMALGQVTLAKLH